MPTVNPNITFIGNDAVLFSWTLTTTDFDGAPVGPNHADYVDRTVQAVGTFGGGTVNFQGSNELEPASNWVNAANQQGTVIALTAAGQQSVGHLNRLQRPLLSGSTGATVTVSMVARRPRSGQAV